MLDLKALLTKITTSLKSPIIYREYYSSSGTTLAAHASSSLSVSITGVTGYKIIAAVYSRTNGNVMVNYPSPVTAGATSATCTVWLRNASTGSMSINSVTVGVLFIRSDLY